MAAASPPLESPSPVSAGATASAPRIRWVQLIIGIVCMTQIANLQYGWTLFVTPLSDALHVGKAAVQVAFTIFVVMETWLVPVEGYLIDRFGPRAVALIGGLLVGVSWMIDSTATSLTALYVAAAIGGIGAGAVYGTAVGNSLKWFPDKRGLAAGLTAAGFGAGSALTVVPIANLIHSAGYQAAFFRFGLVQGVIVMILACWLRAPKPSELVAAPPLATASPAVSRSPSSPFGSRPALASRDATPLEALKTPIFWVMYVMFVLVATGGLMAVAQLAPIAHDFKVADIPVTLIGITLPALPFALSIDRVVNGITRPFFGWVSDHVGRENTMFAAFLLEGAGILLLLHFARTPGLFVVLTGLVFFAWGEIYSLFPATCADTYGKTYVTTIYGMLYTAKGTAALLVPLSSTLSQHSGWSPVFVAASVLNFAAAILALFVLKPMRNRITRAVVLPDAQGISRV